MRSVRHLAGTLLALSKSDPEGLSTSAARLSTEKISLKYQKQVGEIWAQAANEVSYLISTIVENNPKKTPAQVMARPDVKLAIKELYQKAATQAEDLLTAAWDESAENTRKKVLSELKERGIDTSSGGPLPSPDRSVLAMLIKDIHTNADTAAQTYGDYLEKDYSKESIAKASSSMVRRATYSTQGSAWNAASSMRMALFSFFGIHKRWVAKLDYRTCSACRWLDGQAIPAYGEFPHPKGVKIYGPKLLAPPLHPHCRRVLVPSFSKKSKKSA